MSARIIVGLALCAGAMLAVAPQRAEAGVIVLNNGKVFVGRIRHEDKRQVTMTWPYKQLTHRGKQVFEHGQLPHNIRWHRVNGKDEDYDQPNDEYWEQYGDLEKYPIDQRYMELYERWKIRQERRSETNFDELAIIDDPFTKGHRLSSLPEDQNPLFQVNRPEGWSAAVEDEITIFKAREGLEGYIPRIHLFVGPRLKGRTEKIVAMFEEQMAKAADPGSWKIIDKPSPKTVGSGYDYAFTSRSTVRGRNVVALRKIFIREKHIYFYTAYCHEKEYPELRGLFQRCAETVVLTEDKRGAKKKKPAPPK